MNKKIFLAPNSIKSMAAAHAKVYQDKKEYVLRISDCHNTIKLWGKIDSQEDLTEGIEKLRNLIEIATDLKDKLQGISKQEHFYERKDKKLKQWVKESLKVYSIVKIAEKNNEHPSAVAGWIKNSSPEILTIQNINFISEILDIEPHEVWE